MGKWVDMKDYKILALRYLKQNKQRSIITILGTTISVMVLYSLLNMGWGYLLQTRQDMRESQDYEFVLFTETEQQIADILVDSRVKSAYVGQYYSYHGGIGTMYENALYVNTWNPYRLDSVYEQLCSDYGVGGDIHDELAWTYLQGSDGSAVVVAIYFAILAAFIFAIIGVGIIRNSIQLCMYENIRDYGNLRCIGSSKGQLKKIIFLQGMVLEVTGIVIGAALGTIITLILSKSFQTLNLFQFQGGFHWLPLALVFFAFIVDLYFAMGENAKLVTKMTPVSAIRGEYRIRKEKFRLREKNPFRILMSKLFGVDGDYAFKSLMRSPGRFWRTVGALVFGMAAFMAIAGFASSLQTMMKQRMDTYKYYQIYMDNTLEPSENISQVESSLPPNDILQELSESKDITEAKRSYSAIGYVTSLDGLYSHYSEEYMGTFSGELARETYQRSQSYMEQTGEAEDCPILDSVIGVTCVGYDEADLERCRPVLIDGTLELSENGIVLVNQVPAAVPNESEYMDYESDYIITTAVLSDYQVGDTIDIVDIAKMHERLDSEITKVDAQYLEMYEKDLEEDPEDEDGSILTLAGEYNQKRHQLVNECWKELAEEGCYKTYVIEGIIEEDMNITREDVSITSFQILMSQDTYFDLTGTDETQPTGICYHLDKLPKSLKIARIFDYDSGMLDSEPEFIISSRCNISWFINDIEYFQMMNRVMLGVSMVVLFIVVMALLNAVNATSSSLHLRRREFAQLRVIGVSKKHLMRMVMLEGIITASAADIIGILLGFALSYGLFITVTIFFGVPYHFPIVAVIVAVVISVLVLCGAIYFPLRRLSNNMADDLKLGGEG